MTRLELRSSISLSSIFALRMLGLFLILPVFAEHARHLPGGTSALMIGLVLGIYGLTQGILQIPAGMASDRFGRKPVIVVGLVIFALGSFVAASASDIWVTLIGRALQGAGAISAAVTALVADSTRESQRTKSMAMIGGSIALMFALSLVAAPVLYGLIGMGGLFAATGILALVAIWVTLRIVPDAPQPLAHSPGAGALRSVMRNSDILRLNAGIFSLHMVQMAMFIAVPRALVERSGLPLPEHWKVYLPVVVVSLALMGGALRRERSGGPRALFLAAIALVLAVQLAFATYPGGLVLTAVLLTMFFTGFNILEASLPSLISKLAPGNAKGAAMGVYNTTQSLGLFAGGALGGWAMSRCGESAVWAVNSLALICWLVLAAGQRRWRGIEQDSPAAPGR
ncbi:MAG: MFS transporter [Burkholderiaceae bacterium]|nr:MFS transporter [Burkholderiaceae bacterium]